MIALHSRVLWITGKNLASRQLPAGDGRSVR
jgi:hypothetical protein